METAIPLMRIALYAFVTGLSGAMAPGPVLLVVMQQTLRRGFRAAMGVILGHALLELLIVCLLCGGIAGWVSAVEGGRAALRLVGGMALAAFGMLTLLGARHAHGPSAEQDSESGGRWRRAGPPILGAMTSLANPYFLIWWGTAGLGLLGEASHLGGSGVSFFYLGHIASDFAWYALIALSVLAGKSLLTARAYPALLAASGLFMVGFGAYFALAPV